MCVYALIYLYGQVSIAMLNNYQMVAAEIPSKKHQETMFFSWYLAGKPNTYNNL